MMEDDSEDVIFEGSPLFEYLQETCPNEAFASSVPQRYEGLAFLPSQSSDSKSKNGPAGRPTSILSLLLWPWTKLQILFDLREEESIQQLSCQLKTLSWITKSGLINETDKSLFESLENHLNETKKTSHGAAAYVHIFTGAVLLLGAFAHCFVPHVFKLRLVHPLLPVPAEVCAGIFLFAVSVSVFWNVYRHHHLVSILNNQAKGTDDYIRGEQLFRRSFRRSLQYIQEVEVLSRGYTMVSAASYSAGIDVSHHQLLPLRKVCLSVITKHAIVLRAATKSLIAKFPLLPEFNLSDDCISNQRLPEWIQCTATNSSGGLSRSEAEETLSLSTLKILFGLYREQCSDFVHQLAISLVKCEQLQCYERTDLNLLKEWSDSLQVCTVDCEDATNRLDERYKLHRWSPSQECTPTAGTVSRREVWRPEVQLVTALHSLRLHLETTLSKISPLDDKLAECDVISVTGSKLADMKTLVQEIADHIEASQMCYQETKSSLEKLVSKGNPESAIVSEQKMDEPSCAAADQHDPAIHLIDNDDDDSNEINGDMDEQIFEAYIDEKRNMRDDEVSEEWYQEKIQRRREAEDARRLLQELNCILTKRSKQKERNREEKILKMSSKGNKTEKSEEKLTPAASSKEGEKIKTAPSLMEESHSLCTQNECAGNSHNGRLRIESQRLMKDDAESLCDREFNSERENSSSKVDTCAIQDINSGDLRITSDSLQQRDSAPDSKLVYDCSLLDNLTNGGYQRQNVVDSSETRTLDASEKHDLNISPHTFKKLKGSQFNGKLPENEDVGSSNSSKSNNLFETKGECGNSGQCRVDLNSLPYDTEDSVRSYESASKSELSEPMSVVQLQDRASYLAVNPWMFPGLAAQVAKISQQQIRLSEDTFGESDSGDE